MGIVVNPAVVSGSWAQGASYLGYDNVFLRSGASVVASAEDAGYPASNATSWLITGGGWRVTNAGSGNITLTLTLPASESINSYAVFKHNLGTLGATIKLQHSTDGGTWSDFTGSEKVVADDKAIFFIGTPQSALFWRLHIAGVTGGEK